MASTARCPGCGATLPVPSGFTGQAIRCGRCRAVVPLPPPATPARPVLTAEPVPVPPPVASRAAPRPVARALPSDDEPEARRPAARRRSRGRAADASTSVPVRVALLIGGIGLAGLFLVGCCGGVFYYFAFPDRGGGGVVADGGRGSGGAWAGPSGGVPPVTRPATPPAAGPEDGWERKPVPGTALSVEIPRPRLGAVRKGHNPYPALGLSGLYVEREGRHGPVKFLAGPSLANEPKPPSSIAALVQGGRELGPGGWVKRTFTHQGMSAVLAAGRDWTGDGTQESVVLFVQVPSGLVVSFTVIGDGLDETDPDVKRFFDSVRMGR